MAVPLSKTNLIRSTGGGYSNHLPSIEPILSEQAIADESPITISNVEPRTDEWINETDLKDSVFTDSLIETITTVADSILSAIDSGLPYPVQQRIDAWCDFHGFDSIESRKTCIIVARQAALNLLLKTTIYEWHHRRDRLPPLPRDPRKGLQRAMERTGDPAFEANVLDEVTWFTDEAALEPIVNARDRFLETANPAEDIGKVYRALIPNESRRPLGQFQTPFDVGELMRAWATSGDDVVLDPGMGSGVLSRPFHPRWDVCTDPSQVIGVDRSPIATLTGTTAFTLYSQAHRPRATDFLGLTPDDLLTEVDALVCNPPYSRHQDLPADYKVKINAQAKQETGLEIGMASPLYAYFIYHSRQFLGPGDRAAFIVPHHFLAADYGDELKRFLLSEFDIMAFLLVSPSSEGVFEDAFTTALILFLEVPEESDIEGAVRFIRFDGEFERIPALEMVRKGTQGSSEWGFVNCVRQEELAPEENWQSLFEPLSIDLSNLAPLSEIAEISRGILTGENDFFTLSQADVDEWGIDVSYLSQLVPGPKAVRGYDFRPEDWEQHREHGEAVWLLYHLDAIDGIPQTIKTAESGSPAGITLAQETASSASLVEYLQVGLAKHPTLIERRTVRSRSPWYRVDRRDPPPVLVPYMYRSGFRALLNETDARYLNNYLGIYPNASLGQTQVKALLAYLNSSFANEVVRRHERTYAGRMDKLEPGDLADVPVLDPRLLSENSVTTLAYLFDELRATARHDGSSEDIVDCIDAVLRDAL